MVLTDSDGKIVKEIAEPLGRTTNNVAEYTAFIRALQEARVLGESIDYSRQGESALAALLQLSKHEPAPAVPTPAKPAQLPSAPARRKAASASAARVRTAGL